MDVNPALSILEVIATTCGVLIGFLAVFLVVASERKRRKLELLYERRLDLELRKIDALMYPVKSDEIKTKIDERSELIKLTEELLKLNPLHKNILGKCISLNTINTMVLSYTVIIFVFSIIYIGLITFYRSVIDALVYFAIILTVSDLFLIVLIAYWSAVEDYDLSAMFEKALKK